MRKKTRYRISTNFTNGHGVGVLAHSWKQALEQAIEWRPALAMFRGYQPEKTEWGWRIIMGSLAICIETRKRK